MPHKKIPIHWANLITGGLGNPSKMPGRAWGISPKSCRTGAKLAKVEGSICSKCYASKGHYAFASVANCHENRLQGMRSPEWTAAMISLIDKQCAKVPYFRWFDSGDIQSVAHLRQIAEIAVALPHMHFWVATKEGGIYRRTFRRLAPPKNLVTRVSAAMIDGPPPLKFSHTSTVITDKTKATCRAFTTGGECGDCRKCWDPDVKNVSYPLH